MDSSESQNKHGCKPRIQSHHIFPFVKDYASYIYIPYMLNSHMENVTFCLNINILYLKCTSKLFLYFISEITCFHNCQSYYLHTKIPITNWEGKMYLILLALLICTSNNGSYYYLSDKNALLSDINSSCNKNHD